MTTIEAVRKIGLALKRLHVDQGPIARRNARAAVKVAAKRLLQAVDRAFPAPGRKPSRRTGRLPTHLWHRKMKLRGWRPCVFASVATACAEAGIRIKKDPSRSNAWWVPGWIDDTMSASVLARLKRNPTERKISQVKYALQRLGGVTEGGTPIDAGGF